MNFKNFLFILLLTVTFSVFSQEKKYTTYQAKKGETVYSISQKFSITPHDLLNLNPDIKDGLAENQLIIIPNKNYKPTPDANAGDYLEAGFLYHKVLPKENYFRLKKKYGVSKRQLRKHNLALRTSDLKAGQIIKIPANRAVRASIKPAKEDTSTKPYLVKPKETKYSISRRYGISIEKLEEMNPEIREGLKLAQIIKVPNTAEIPDPEADFNMHQIEKGETMFSLSQSFKLSQEQLLELNPELAEGVKEGALIKIPKLITAENTSDFTPDSLLNKEVKIAMLLPFMGNKSSFDFEKDRTLKIVTDFYLGALFAIDSLKQQGLSVSVKVFDTKNSKTEIANILKLNDLSRMDAVVGPMFLDNVKFVSQSLQIDSTALISPVSAKDHSNFASKNTVREAPSNNVLTEAMLKYIEENYHGQQLVVIADDNKDLEAELKKIVDRLVDIDSLKNVAVLKPEKGYIKPDLFKKTIVEEKDNWILLVSEDEVVTADVVNNLGVMPENIRATLFALKNGNNFDRVDNNFLARVNFHYPSSNFVDREDRSINKFIDKFKRKNYVEPSEFAFKGFDIVYDALLRLATYGSYENAFDGGVSRRTSSKFMYTKNANTGFENKGVFLVKYEGLDLKEID